MKGHGNITLRCGTSANAIFAMKGFVATDSNFTLDDFLVQTDQDYTVEFIAPAVL